MLRFVRLRRLNLRLAHTKVDYKDTLNLPKTGFSKNIPPHEPDASKSRNLYRKHSQSLIERPVFTVFDGPPFANGQLHIGHFLNKILKDITIRSRIAEGHSINIRPGWDCHGLPIEQKALSSGAADRQDHVNIRRKCREYAMAAMHDQRADMERWGLLADLEAPYLTMSPAYEAEQIRVFAKMWQRGLIYRAKKPVYWSPSSMTALAEAELEYTDLAQTACYVKFPIVQGALSGKNLLIWTTTPWTIPANQAVAINTNLQYVCVDDNFIIAQSCLANIGHSGEVREVSIEDILSCKYQSPISKQLCPVLHGDFVESSQGSGMVHIACAHGQDDFMLGRKHGLEPVDIIDAAGRYTSGAGNELVGLEAMTAGSEQVLQSMADNDLLMNAEIIYHRYPLDWRTKKPIMLKATDQWFVSLDPIRQDLLKAVDSIKFNPQHGRDRLIRMIEQRGDWCISRQRCWGVPIPAFFRRGGGGEPIMTTSIMEHIAGLFDRRGSDCWWEGETRDLLPKEHQHDAENLERSLDTMDVWFDSGTAWTTLPNHLHGPVMQIEGGDQFRGWFQSSLVTAIASGQPQPPATHIVSHGFVLDEHLRKMSKSLGNVVEPNHLIKKYGLDVIRLWAASSTFHDDVSLSEKSLNQAREVYAKFRNTFKFLLGNLHDYVDSPIVRELDLYAVERSQQTMNRVFKHFAIDSMEYARGVSLVHAFAANDLSAFYLDVIKDRLYVYPVGSAARRSAQAALYKLTSHLSLMLSAVLPNLVEEVRKHVSLPTTLVFAERPIDESLLSRYEAVHDLKSELLKVAESKSLAKYHVSLPDEYLRQYEVESLMEALQCIDIRLGHGIEVSLTKNHKCPRCWSYKAIADDELCKLCSQSNSHLEHA